MTTTKTTIITGTAAELIDYVCNNPNAEEIREMINVREYKRELSRFAAHSSDMDSVILDAGFTIGDVITHYAIRTHGLNGWSAGTTDFIDEEDFE